MSDLQLERSVLEAKERDELFAIALALGTSPAARTKKADLVSHILQVTGVEQEQPPSTEKPRASRSRRSAATTTRDAVPAEGSQQLELAATNGHGAKPVVEVTATAPLDVAEARASAARPLSRTPKWSNRRRRWTKRSPDQARRQAEMALRRSSEERQVVSVTI